MEIIHGTWIPEETSEFIQSGGFYVWVETDAPTGTKRRTPDDTSHPRHLSGEPLAAFLTGMAGVSVSYPATLHGTISTRSFLLPSDEKGPLPSTELLRSLGAEPPEAFTFRPWAVCCHQLDDVIAALNDIHFAALHHTEEYQLGADLRFWWQYTQTFKQIVARDQYIPALKYRAPPPTTGKKGKRAERLELFPAWEMLSERYDDAIRDYAPAMPLACASGMAASDAPAALYEREALLRHFSEHLLREIVTGTPFTAAFDKQIAETLLSDCLYPYRPRLIRQSSDGALTEYTHWLGWRAKLIGGHATADFTLCFRLEEAASEEADDWRLHFLVAPKRDPSRKVSLAEYWSFNTTAHAEFLRAVGQDFERHLLLALGYAARMYAKVWAGLETDRPVGFALNRDEAFAFLKEDAWVLEDAGFTVIVPSWWTPAGRRRAMIRLKTSAQTGKKGGAAAGNGLLNLDTIIAYEYQLSIGGEVVTEAEWRRLIDAKTPLVRFRGEWMELDRDKMRQMLDFWQTRALEQSDLTPLDLMRIAAEEGDEVEWDHDATVRAMMARLEDKSALAPVPDSPNLCGTLREYQRRGVAWLQYLESIGLNPCLADDMGLGKCLAPDTRIVVNGAFETAASLWESYAAAEWSDGEGVWAHPTVPLLVPALDQETGKITLASVQRLYRQHIREPLRTVTLADGTRVTTTRRHQFLTSAGWTNDLHVSDYVCVPATIPWDGVPEDPDLITFLAWQIAEGHEISEQARVVISQKDEERLEDLRRVLLRIAERYELKINHPAIRADGVACSGLFIHSRAYQRFLEARGYQWGKHSKDKVIPSFVLQANLASVRLFLKSYFDAEASVIRSMRSIEISSASPLLIQQLSLLLRRCGIWLRVSTKEKRATNGSGIFRPYSFGVIGGNSARRFLQEIGFSNPRKQDLLEEICQYEGNTNIEGIPASAAIAEVVRTTGLPVRHFGMHTRVYLDGSQQFSRASLQRVQDRCDDLISGVAEREYRAKKPSKWTAQTLDRYAQLDRHHLMQTRQHVQRLLDQEVFYCKIKSIEEYDYEGWVYDFEVAQHHNFVANNVLCHNTVQVIARLVNERDTATATGPTLLIAPTSVLSNWRREIERFAPDLRALVHQGSGRAKQEEAFQAACGGHDVVITSFAMARLDEKLLRSVAWQRVVVDEAQNIKNPQAAQTRAILKLPARHRMALTGTPVENRLLDLWSIFNFLNPGYLGKEAQFRKSFESPIQRENDRERAATLKKLVEPFILRRVKTDKSIISDLPDKVEQRLFCNLTREQASLYEAVVKDVAERIEETSGMERRGLMLATLLRLKQICNHPAHFLQDGSAFTSERSHKLSRLAEMIEEVIESGESALVFSQFTEIGEALERYVQQTLHANTYYLHGGTSAKRREAMIAEFQDAETEPSIFLLSLRAGGVGITLTKANHVFHFDRWWNPAVEDQATDRAFRIGQRKNVFVHKFVAIGTVEERIDQMIEEKKGLAAAIVGADESWLTELDNDAFKELIALRTSAVLE